ncbi:hypothetical protein [Oerskovia flava]|uniref:hypothetical protein n=1 Tax=Oerskovia flava TaxID=2986422 RepID=UPI00224087AD|nr:hypothetical protein [Oerskovia sp. JB1-3-2]
MEPGSRLPRATETIVDTTAPTPADDTAARLAALERENAELRARLARADASGDGPPGGDRPTSGPATPRHRARTAMAVLLITLGALLAPAGAVAAWAQRTITDTDRYVETVGPLGSDPVLQSALAGRLTSVVMEQIDVPALLAEASDALTEQDVAPRAAVALTALEGPLTDGVRSFVQRAADGLVRSDGFETTWVQANRVAHQQMVAVMEGSDGTMLQIGDQGQLTIQLSGMIDLLKERLVERGLGVAARIPEIDATFTIVQTSQLVQVQNAYGLLDTVGTWLPWVALGLLAAGVLVAVRRPRALVAAGLALAGSMVLLGVALFVARGLYLDALSAQVLRLDAAEVVFDQLVGFLRLSLRTVGVLGLVVALAAYLGGGSASARSLRASISRGAGSLREAAAGRGVSAGPVGEWLGRHRGFVRVVVVAGAALVLLFAATPTAGLVVGTAIVAGLLLTLVEILAAPPPTPEPTTP